MVISIEPHGIQRAIVGLCLILLSGCDSGQIPADSSLVISPDERRIAIRVGYDPTTDSCQTVNFPYLDVPVLVSLVDAQTSPIGGISAFISADWSGPTTSSFAPVTLLYDFNSDGVVDSETEQVSAADGRVFEKETDDQTGDVHLTLRLNLSCPYRGEITAISGGLYASSSFETYSEPEPEPEPITSLRWSL